MREQSSEKTGVLIANLGTPDAYDYWSMRRYLNEFLSDTRVIDYSWWKWQPILQTIVLTIRPFKSGKAYKSIWNEEANESPLMTITKAQAAKLREALKDEDIEVEFCMRYGNPSTASVLEKMVAKGCNRILFFPLYPHYSGPTTAAANDGFFKALMKTRVQPTSRTVHPYYDDPAYIEALAASVRRVYPTEADAPDMLICSYHGLPERYVELGDPYERHCRKSTELLANALGWSKDRIISTFQSKFGPEEWLKPYTVEKVADLAREGKKNIAIMAPAFSSDCIETLEEINDEIKESFEDAGGESFTYIPCLNDDAAHIDALADIIRRNLENW